MKLYDLTKCYRRIEENPDSIHYLEYIVFPYEKLFYGCLINLLRV